MYCGKCHTLPIEVETCMDFNCGDFLQGSGPGCVYLMDQSSDCPECGCPISKHQADGCTEDIAAGSKACKTRLLVHNSKLESQGRGIKTTPLEFR
jgi:hypothetical protein